MSVSSIQCPKCHTQISVDEVLRHQIEESVKGDLRDEYNQKYISLKLQLSEQSQKEKLELQEQLSKNKKEIETFRENELILRKKAQELEEKDQRIESLKNPWMRLKEKPQLVLNSFKVR